LLNLNLLSNEWDKRNDKHAFIWSEHIPKQAIFDIERPKVAFGVGASYSWYLVLLFWATFAKNVGCAFSTPAARACEYIVNHGLKD
jgi:hypothetical protein